MTKTSGRGRIAVLLALLALSACGTSHAIQRARADALEALLQQCQSGDRQACMDVANTPLVIKEGRQPITPSYTVRP